MRWCYRSVQTAYSVNSPSNEWQMVVITGSGLECVPGLDSVSFAAAQAVEANAYSEGVNSGSMALTIPQPESGSSSRAIVHPSSG